MTKNMGVADRVIRTLIALGIAALYFTHHLSGTLAIVLEVIAIVFVVTSFLGRCPGYLLFGFSTRKPPSGPSAP